MIYLIQALNSETGKPIWSLESSTRKYLFRFKDGFIMFDNYGKAEPAKLVDFEGNIIKEVKLTI